MMRPALAKAGAGFALEDSMADPVGTVKMPDGTVVDTQELEDRAFARTIMLLSGENYEALLKELEYHQKKWGPEHDSKHTPEDWVVILANYVGKASNETPLYTGKDWWDREKLKKRLIQIAAISLSACEAIDAAQRTGTA